ncbi:MAG: SapC family protein [Rhodospirillaceae bacterium]
MSNDQSDVPASKVTANMEDRQDTPLFYEEPVALTASMHSDFCIQPESDFKFALDTNAVPITVAEFVLASRHYPIVFVGEQFVPTVALGLRQDQNLFVDQNGLWERRCYIPAYVRRYPFILLGKEDDKKLQLGIDNSARSDESDARALFSGETETQVVTDALDLCQQFHSAFKATLDFSAMIADSGLIEERSLELEFPNNEKISIGSFSSISEQKFREAPETKILEWRSKGWLAAIYFHIASLNNWDLMIDRLPESQ